LLVSSSAERAAGSVAIEVLDADRAEREHRALVALLKDCTIQVEREQKPEAPADDKRASA